MSARIAALGLASLLSGLALAARLATAAPVSAPPAGTPAAFTDLPGFASDDLAAAFKVFQASCKALADDRPALRLGAPAPEALKPVCQAALALGDLSDPAQARRFFEAHFAPRRLEPGFVTGYYEPVVEGSLEKTPAFRTPLLARPDDLVGGSPGQPLPGLDPSLSAGRKTACGPLEPYPDRAAIEAGALGPLAKPLVYVRDPVEAFFIHVQGSARIHLPDGSLRRLVYAGRNGQPYTSIGRRLVERLGIPPAKMGMAELRAWIRAHGQEPGEAGAKLMQENRSYIFFAFDPTLEADQGPIGGAGIPLTPLRSLAIDRQIWPYGLPVYVDASLPWRGSEPEPFRRLLIAQDTGSAIVGPARGDIFFGTGAQAAQLAGPIRHGATLYVLWPKGAAAIASGREQ